MTPPRLIPKRHSDRDEFENRPLETRLQHVEVDKRELNSENQMRGVLELRSRSVASTERNRSLSGAISVYYVWRMRFVRYWWRNPQVTASIGSSCQLTVLFHRRQHSFTPYFVTSQPGLMATDAKAFTRQCPICSD